MSVQKPNSQSDTTPIPPWAPCKRPLGCDYPDCECHSQTTGATITAYGAGAGNGESAIGKCEVKLMPDKPNTTEVRQSVGQLALELWAELDTKVEPLGAIDHTQAVPVIKQWPIEQSSVILETLKHVR